ncbi:MAG TPA: AmmeMemoRadiSam system protein B [Candidatus Peribacteraceae bacterium]|nr:AmmeMemoRadiSam system protein B [Candidatus Peribacteraceae bacterium]
MNHPVVSFADPYTSPQQFMEGIYTADHTIDPPPKQYVIRGVVVPHHLTATTDIAAGIAMLKHQSFKRILLISPDHFHKCPTIICTVNAEYQTQFGTVRADPQLVDQLALSNLTTVEPDLFTNEHGIYAVLPFIKHYFPSVSVTPMVLSQDHPWLSSSGDLLDSISALTEEKTMVIVSSDFSHYLPLKNAQQEDEKTAETLFAGDLKGIARLDDPSQSDCPGCLWLLGSLAKEGGFYNPSVILHTNSATILGDPTVRSTTSHFAMVWYQNADLRPSDVAVAGDVTLTRNPYPPTLPADMQQFWSGSGARLVNLEGPLAQYCPPDRSMFDFCNSHKLFAGIQSIATHWGMMNNHMLDQHLAGIAETKQLLESAGKTPVDDVIAESGGVRMVALTALMNPVIDAPKMDLMSMQQRVLRELRALPRDNKLTIVLVHSGKEYQALTSDEERRYLESFIDAGADAVVASHTHVQSDLFIYKGKPIFEGVGNFLFDQHDSIPTSTAKAVRLRKVGGTVEFQTFMTRT